jgi:translation initiation factor 2 subunit 2
MNAEEYKKMLEEGKKELPDNLSHKERFEIPGVKGHIQGNRTIIANFSKIANTLGRKPEHLLKYVQKELASPGELIKGVVIFGSKISAKKINQKISQYAEEFVICKECGKPDTELMKKEGILFVKCNACGARHSTGSSA